MYNVNEKKNRSQKLNKIRNFKILNTIISIYYNIIIFPYSSKCLLLFLFVKYFYIDLFNSQ